MDLAYHDDWESARRHLEAWWANDALDRAAIAVTAPRDRPVGASGPEPQPPSDPVDRWLNADYRVTAADYGMRRTFYGGESLPIFWPNLGPGIAAAYLGVEPVFAPDTVWFNQTARHWKDLAPRFDPDNKWWQATLNLVRVAVEASDGNFFVGHTDIGGVIDIEASLRGTPALLTDLVDAAREVKRVRGQLIPLWFRWYEEQERIIHRRLDGASCWLGVWAPGRTYNIQCDFCCMISPAHFDEFVAPELEALCSWLDYVTYHLDGPGAARHLDRLLAIAELHGIQWTPGAGQPSAVAWLPMLKKIQSAGKILHLHDDIANVETILRELSPRGLMLSVSGCRSEAEARELLRKSEEWSRSR
ncbi:MAG: hypothetical protein JSV65_10890 [Armatimonadota bacterium]|nr:MAG: hypothetical protein JSV65_10890 [Armatimonadota bacterium]